MTAGERLAQISGLSGVSAAAMLLAIGTGATAGALLVDYSGLESGTAAEHLLTDASIVVPPQVSEAGAGYYPYPLQIDDIEEETLFIFTATRN